jgi:hypothetical protein
MAQSIARIILSRVIGFLLFLVILAIANVLISSINNQVYTDTVDFFNTNLTIIIIVTFFGLVNDIFWTFYFPFNILAPVISAVLSVYIVTFIYRFWLFANNYIKFQLTIPINTIYLVVVLLVLILGYIVILARGGRPRQEWKERHEERRERRKEEVQERLDNLDKRIKAKQLEWEEVGDQFKSALYKVGEKLNNSLDNKKPKRKSRKKKKL